MTGSGCSSTQTCGIASIGQLAFPADQPLALKLTSDTVMQSFFVPALGSQIYAMAGMVTRLHLQASAPGNVSRREHPVQRRRILQAKVHGARR